MSEFVAGDSVFYVPEHAKDSLAHPDVEPGTVTHVTGPFVFVRFKGEQGVACDRRNLVRVP